MPISFLCLPGMTGSLKEGGKGVETTGAQATPSSDAPSVSTKPWICVHPGVNGFSQPPFLGRPPLAPLLPGPSYFARPTRNCCWTQTEIRETRQQLLCLNVRHSSSTLLPGSLLRDSSSEIGVSTRSGCFLLLLEYCVTLPRP